MSDTREIPVATGASVVALRKWLDIRAEVRIHLNRLRDAQQRLRALELDVPWLGNFKGTIRKRAGVAAKIPEGP